MLQKLARHKEIAILFVLYFLVHVATTERKIEHIYIFLGLFLVQEFCNEIGLVA